MVISEKLKVTRMNGDTVGFGGEYDIKDVPHAMRLTDSGTFIHGNYWGGERLRQLQRQPRLRRPAGRHAAADDSERAGGLVLRPLDDRRRGRS